MKKRLMTALLIFACAVLLLIPSKVSAQEAFNISGFDVNIDISAANVLSVRETIKVDYTEYRHGIIRYIPAKTYNGLRVKIGHVNVEGYKFQTEYENGYLLIQIGDPDRYADEHEVYVITYTYDIGDDNWEEGDEVYFNLIGDQWDCSIDDITFDITLPYDFSAEPNFTHGPRGSKDNTGVKYKVNGRNIAGSFAHLDNNEALTIALTLPQGYFDQVKKRVDYSPYILWGAFAACSLIGVGLWLRLGKAEFTPVETVEFYPPDGLTPTEAGYILDGTVDSYDITSLLIYWASRGYMRIDESKWKLRKTYIFTKLADLPQDSKAFERIMFYSIFNDYGNGRAADSRRMVNRFYKTVNTVKARITSDYSEGGRFGIFAKGNLFCSIMLIVLGVLSFAAVFMTGIYGTGEFFGASLGFGGMLSIFMSAAMLYSVYLVDNCFPLRKSASWLLKIPFALLFAAIVLFAAYAFRVKIALPAYFCCLAGGILLFILSVNCKKRTYYGAQIYGRVRGFRNFLEATEKDRIRLLCDEDPQYFYKILPYAMVFRITKKYVKAFEGLTLEPPEWYGPYDSSYFDANSFVRDIDSNMHSISNTLSSSPSSSDSGGSSGGGSSGGGSGGGGGSSW